MGSFCETSIRSFDRPLVVCHVGSQQRGADEQELGPKKLAGRKTLEIRSSATSKLGVVVAPGNVWL